MKSTAHVYGHPIHPMLIPYPFALLTSALAFDVTARTLGREACARTASHLTAAGLGTALFAAAPGILDYFGTVPRGTAARRSAFQHASCNVGGLACFALAHGRRRDDARQTGPGLMLEAIGTGLLLLGGWLGGQLIYHEHVGVVTAADTTADRARIPRGVGGDAAEAQAATR